MTLDNIVTFGTFIISIVAIIFSLRKQKHDVANLDADTIAKLYNTIEKQEEMYRELKKEFEDYKKSTDSQIRILKDENEDLRARLKIAENKNNYGGQNVS